MPRPQATTYRTLRAAGFGAALAATVSAVPPHRPLEVDPFMLMVLAGLAGKTAGTLLDSRLKPHSLAIVTGALLITALSGAALQVVRRPLVHPDVFILLALLGLAGMLPELRQPSWRRPRATPASPDRATVGDRWELVRPLPGADRGGFSDLWLGADLNRERRPVVVKLESGAPDRKEESRKRLQREYGLLGGIQSRYVIDLHDGGRDPASGRQYIVLTRYPAGSLARRLAAASQLPLSWAVEVFAGILAGLMALHEQLPHPIVHRDITPRNVLLRADGTPVLCDFGSARLLRRGDRRGDDQVTAGVVYSHYYAPPELVDQGLRDRWDPTPTTDLYAAGSILYELLTGRPPYWREERGAHLEFARLALDPNLRPVPPTWVNPDLPPGIDELLARTLAFQPNERPDSARDLLTQLHAIGPSEVDSQIPFAELRTAPIPVALGTTTTRSEL
jgi:serine/threonine protein kinase